jgi:broad specificity phosphatase PhoE
MPVYVIRHEIRCSNDPSFFSPLTAEGKQNAIALIQKLDSLKIEHVFSSPFLRCIQTVLPYCWKYGINMRIENSLYECLSSTRFTTSDIQTTMSSETKIALGIQNGYKSWTHLDEIKLDQYPLKRVEDFVEYVRTMFSPTSSVLICTHMDCINTIFGQPKGTHVPMGEIIEIR